MRYLCYLLILLCCGCNTLLDGYRYIDTTSEIGYTYANIKGEDINAIPISIRPSWNINRVIHLNPKYGFLDWGIEGFAFALLEPDRGAIAGITPILRYTYPVYEWMGLYLEGGVGPSYISIDTHEQEASGFSFLDQIGAGVRMQFSDTFSFRFGYRFGHFSHGGILDTRNRGIETHTFVFGLSFWFP